MSVGGSITTLDQLAQDLSSLRRRHAAEIASFLKRIDPVIFEEQDTEELLRPLTLSLAEKQQQTNHLLSILGLTIPSIDQTTDQLINQMEKKKKLAKEAVVQKALETINMKSVVKTETIDVAVQTESAITVDDLDDLDDEDINKIIITKKTTSGRFSEEETALIRKCLPRFGLDIEAYQRVMPYVPLERLRRKVHTEKLNPDVILLLRSQEQASSRDNSRATSPAGDNPAADGPVTDSQVGDSQADKSSEGSDSEEEPKWQPEKRLRPRKKVHYIVEPLRSPSPKRSRIDDDDDGSSSEDEPDSNANSSDA
ncbi:hypothetical protein INT43_006896 [Umbelopsis isabellina]|uniref:Uncharacterized protein n=1 Tax=Mortierella isabellina TaxID=91625 RepID=A0A8H7UDT0_MORIS|nr:hypothetical protein INT43_006896 [Umbelopsis isabellina]